jgi:hypothetical protein
VTKYFAASVSVNVNYAQLPNRSDNRASSRKGVMESLVAAYGPRYTDLSSYMKRDSPCVPVTQDSFPFIFFLTHEHDMRVCIFHLYRKWGFLCIQPDKT